MRGLWSVFEAWTGHGYTALFTYLPIDTCNAQDIEGGEETADPAGHGGGVLFLVSGVFSYLCIYLFLGALS